MGYNSWYQNGPGISEAFIKGIADAMATNGLKDAGYQYVCLDDGWQGYRDTNGFIVPDTNKFPSGLKSLADYVHAKGLKIGIYTGFGRTTCAGLPGSCGHISQDANTFADWGIDYLKYEGCSACGPDDSIQTQCQLMGDALRDCGRPILFNMSIFDAQAWMPDQLNSWRGTGDINPFFPTMYSHLDFVAKTPQLAGPGHWNDPDVLMTSYGFTRPEKMSTFGMWCMVAAPLLLAGFDPSYMDILTNRELIAVDQDPAGVQGVCVLTNGNSQVWCKPLGTDGAVKAVALLNRDTVAATIAANWSTLGLPNSSAAVRDLWAHAWVGNLTNSYTANVLPHGCQIVTIAPGASVPLPPPGTNFLSDLEWDAATLTTNPVPTQRNLNLAGGPLRLHGVTYSKGLATHTYSYIEYLLSAAATRFISDIGIDDSACCGASVIFRIWGDGRLLYDSGLITSNSPTQHVDLDLTGCNRLLLEVRDGAGPSSNNQGDWAGARVVVSTVPSQPSAAVSGRSVNLSWYPVSGATSYNVWRATSSGGPYVLAGNSGTNSFIDTNIAGDTVYYYAISALSAAGESAKSPEAQIELAAGWNNTITAMPQAWNVNGNWTNTSSFPNRIGKGVEVTANIPANQTILLNQPLTIGWLTIGDPAGGSYTLLGNGGYLTFDNGNLAAQITQLAWSSGDTLQCPITFTGTLQIANLSTNPLTITGTNSFTGPVTLQQGSLRLGSGSALGDPSSPTTIQAGASLDLNGLNIGSEPLLVSGPGVNFAGAIQNNNNAQSALISWLTLNADSSFGGSGDWGLLGTNASFPSAKLHSQGQSYTLTKTGSNTVTLRSVSVDQALGDIHIAQGTLSIEAATTSVGDPAKAFIVDPGASLALRDCTNALNKIFTLQGDGVTASLTNSSGSNTIAGPISLTNNCVISAGSGTLTLAGPVSGSGALIKTGSGAVALGGPTVYAGTTSIKSGSLRLVNSGSLASTTFDLDSAGTLDVTGTPGGSLALPPNSTFSGSGLIRGDLSVGTESWLIPDPQHVLSFSNNLTFASTNARCAMTISKQPITNSQLRVAGNLTLGGILVININFGSNVFVAGDQFPLFSAGAYSGSFDHIEPSIPAPGFFWDASDLTNHGILRVVAAQLPQLGPLRVVGNSVIISGNGGLSTLPGDPYFLLSSTNFALPMSQWPRIATGQFDLNNNFSASDPTPATNSRPVYYRLQTR